MEWESYTRLNAYLDELEKKGDIDVSYDQNGVVVLKRIGKGIKYLKGHLDLYDMKGFEPDWEKGTVECKTEEIKDLFAQIYSKNWEKEYKKYCEYELE